VDEDERLVTANSDSEGEVELADLSEIERGSQVKIEGKVY